LRRRAETMARPARVRIRRRKPWVLCRRRLFGWNVRLLTSSLRCRVLTRLSRTGQAGTPHGWHGTDPRSARAELGLRRRSAGTAHPRLTFSLSLVPGHSAGCRELRTIRGHAAPVDTGPTNQRYVVASARVKPASRPSPDAPGIRGAHPACGQLLAPQVAALLPSQLSRRFPWFPGFSPRVTSSALASWQPHECRKHLLTWADACPEAEVADVVPALLTEEGHDAQPVDKRVERTRPVGR